MSEGSKPETEGFLSDLRRRLEKRQWGSEGKAWSEKKIWADQGHALVHVHVHVHVHIHGE